MHVRTDLLKPFFYDDLWISFYRTVLNSVLYLSSKDLDVQEMASSLENLRDRLLITRSEKKKKRLKSRLGKLKKVASGLPYIHVGGRMDESPMHEDYRRTRSHGWRKIMKRFIVRGHWRMQPHGKGRLKRKIIWIEPPWKGQKDISEVIDKKYIVD